MGVRGYVRLAILLSLFLGFWVFLSLRPGEQAGAELIVSAAASLSEPLSAITVAFSESHPTVQVILNLAASGSLARQIERGAPVDVAIFASSHEMDVLELQGLIESGTRRDLLTNRLVLVVPARSASALDGWEDLAFVNRLAIALPEVAPLGQYSQQVLEYLDLWGRVKTRLVMARDAQQVVSMVSTGNVDAAIIYVTSATHPGVRVVGEAPPGSHQPPIYPAAVLSSSRRSALAQEFLNFLFEEEAQAIFRASGFRTPGGL
jgi:molybdate transport system substrate-binding protein